ncbi:Lrp/AsnC family transcriptional regulator [Pseudoroseomonas globiformis]|uniref:Lrp/AsnC family transcriptional regulator n=1 Tax=Teichococcus globiformis TaxID=2307229 RepID=A0ABV7G2J6_9PROT
MQSPNLDAIDRRMLRLLRADGRMSNAALAEAVGLSPSACLRRLRLLEQGGAIRGYTAILAAPDASSRTVVIVQITLEKQTEDAFNRFEAAVRQCPEICECYLMTGASDYLVRVEARDAADYERIHKEQLSRMPGVSRIQSAFAIRTVVQGAAPAWVEE